MQEWDQWTKDAFEHVAGTTNDAKMDDAYEDPDDDEVVDFFKREQAANAAWEKDNLQTTEDGETDGANI